MSWHRGPISWESSTTLLLRVGGAFSGELKRPQGACAAWSMGQDRLMLLHGDSCLQVAKKDLGGGPIVSVTRWARNSYLPS